MRVESLVDVIPAAAASIGVSLDDSIDPLGEFSHAVVLLVDGLGSHNLAEHAQHAPDLIGARSIRTVFPATTPAGLGALGTALPPGVHGLIGASFLDPDTDAIVTPLQWRNDPNPIALQPHPTAFERLERAGVKVNTVAPVAYQNSGLTRAVLRGGSYLGAESISDRVDHVARVSRSHGLTYVYWSQLDRTGHVHGVDSDAWRAALSDVNTLAVALRECMPSSAGLIITADHGMVDIQHRIDIDESAELMAGVAHICGEPRARLIYAIESERDAVLGRWRAVLEGVATVYAPQEFASLYGAIDADVADRFPDLIAIAHDGVLLASMRTDARVSKLIGQHGGVSEIETAIPLIVR